jgi:NTE family protein
MPEDDPNSVRELRAFLLSGKTAKFRSALAAFRIQVDLATATGTSVNPMQFFETVEVIEKTVHILLESKLREWAGPPSLMGPESAKTLGEVLYRGRAALLISLGGLLTAAGVDNPRQFLLDIMRIAFGVDPFHVRLGDFIGDYPFSDNSPPLPPELIGFREFVEGTCVRSIVSAGIDFGRAAGLRPRPLGGISITGVDPNHGCAGDEVHVRGTGFGTTQPAEVSVMFSTRDGGCTKAVVLAWSDTEITVVAPPNVGQGCVGLTEIPSGGGSIAEAADSFAGALESCLGPAAGIAGGHIRDSATQIMAAACPDCSNPATRFSGGPPVITAFSANGRSDTDIMPGDNVTVAWTVDGADGVTIQPIGGLLPAIPGPLDPLGGSVVVKVVLPDGVVGEWSLVAFNDCGTTTARIHVVVNGRKALALSGGGSKAAFEVGAIRCLRDVAGIHPVIISGSSAGALNAAKLAEGGVALWELEQLWLSLQDYTYLYLEPRWFQILEPVMQSLLKGGSSRLVQAAAQFAGDFVQSKVLGALLSAAGIPGIFYTIYTSVFPVVTGVVTVVRYYDALQQALAANALFDFTPMEQMINANIDPAKVTISGIELRITAVNLVSGELRVIDQNGFFLDSAFPQVPLLDAVRASASVPIAFPPVALPGLNGMEPYVDGGVRENVPVRAAVEAGAHRVYAILLNPKAPNVGTGSTKMIDVAGRVANIILDEGQRDDFAPFRGFGIPVSVIDPTFLVHDTLMVEPGLISINMDYGYMRAYDQVVVKPADRDALRNLSDEITVARIEAWVQEYWANGELLPGLVQPRPLVPVPDPFALQSARDFKKIIRTKTFERINLSSSNSVPSYRANWWLRWERHAWQPLNPSPWDSMTDYGQGGLNAEAPPPP